MVDLEYLRAWGMTNMVIIEKFNESQKGEK